MKTNNGEVITNRTGEDLKDVLQTAENKVQQIEMEASEAEDEARGLELELMQAQAAHERKEEAERQGKETNEKIGEMAG